MLSLIGLGLYNEKDVTLRGLKEMKECEELYLETYTSQWMGKGRLEKKLKKEIEEVGRSDLEENSVEIIEEAKNKKVGVLVPGDPLVATTHVELLIQARKKGIKTKIIHSSSIYSAVAETGLQIYKFGKTTTIPFPEKNYRPGSPYSVIKKNREQGLHTLALLDTKPDKTMDIGEGLSYLLQLEKEKNEKVIGPNDWVVALSVGGKKSHIAYDTVDAMLQRNFQKPSVLIFPAELHEKEEGALKLFREYRG